MIEDTELAHDLPRLDLAVLCLHPLALGFRRLRHQPLDPLLEHGGAPARVPGLRFVGNLRRPRGLHLRLGLRHGLVGLLDLARQVQAGGLGDLMLHMEQIRGVVRTKILLDMP